MRRFFGILLSALLVIGLAGVFPAAAAEQTVCLVVGEPNALVNGEKKPIDGSNPGVAPFLQGDTTMVPVRFIAEALGAEVGFDDAAQRVLITLGQDQISMTVGENELVKNGEAARMDAPSLLWEDGRTFVPLRACAQAFGKQVFWDDMGLIVISDGMAAYNRDENLKELLHMIGAVTYERPSGGQMMDDLAQNSPAHPRLLAKQSDFDRLKELLKTDTRLQGWVAQLEADAKTMMNAKLPEYGLDEGSRLNADAKASKERILTLVLLYQLTGKQEYAERVWAEMEAACGFPDWHPGHFLDASAMMIGVAVGYDWLYQELTPEQRKTAEEALYRFAVLDGLSAYAGTTEGIEAHFGAFGRSGWTTTDNNWNAVCNSGLMFACIALGETYQDDVAELMGKMIRSIEVGVECYAVDGGYPEGPSYWAYGTGHLAQMIAAMDKAMGRDYGIFKAPGLRETGYFPSYLEGTGGMWNYHDCGDGWVDTSWLFWFADKLQNPDLAGLRLQSIERGEKKLDMRDVLWYQPQQLEQPAALPLDQNYETIDTVTMRSSWEDSAAVFTGLHGGSNAVNHGNLDIGNFILDAGGQRWIEDLGKDNYNVPSYFDGASGGMRWKYYRNRGEGQNVVIMDPGAEEDQIVNATGKIITLQSEPKAAFAIADTAQAYGDKVKSARRGVFLTDNRRSVVVQDEIVPDGTHDFWWFAHTKTAVSVAEDGRSAILEKDGKQLWVGLVSPMQDARFTLMDADPLPTSPKSDPGEFDRSAYKKLAVHVKTDQPYQLAVQMRLLEPEQLQPQECYEFTAMKDWQTPEGAVTVPKLKNILVDGQDLEGFDPLKREYEIVLPYGTEEVPEVISVTENGLPYKVEQSMPDQLPGTAQIKVSLDSDPSMYQIYSVRLRAAREIEISASSFQQGNPPENSMDGNLGTRWAAEGTQWIQYTFAQPRLLSSVWIAYWHCDTRQNLFDIQVSEDAETFRTVYEGQTALGTDELREYPIAPVMAKAVRIACKGNTANQWNSILEVDFQ